MSHKCQLWTHAPQQSPHYSMTSSARATSIGGERERELIDRLAPPHTGAYDFRYSVLYLGPSSLAFLLRCSRSCSVRLGGGAVRASTESPIAMKNSSCPGGVHMQSIRAAPPEIFLKKCGAFAGTLIVEPARIIDFWPRKVNSSSPSSNVNISSWWGALAWLIWHVI
jgi:hypothetical protein